MESRAFFLTRRSQRDYAEPGVFILKETRQTVKETVGRYEEQGGKEFNM